MLLLNTFSSLQKITSSFLNSLQGVVFGGGPANRNGLYPPTGVLGGDTIWFEQGNTPNLIPNGTLYEIDARDWRDRVVWGSCLIIPSASDLIENSTDYNFDAVTIGGLSGGEYTVFEGYTGLGAWHATTGSGTAVSNSSGPIRGKTSGGDTLTSWFINLTSTPGALALYCDPTSGALYLYNATSADIVAIALRLHFSGVTTLR